MGLGFVVGGAEVIEGISDLVRSQFRKNPEYSSVILIGTPVEINGETFNASDLSDPNKTYRATHELQQAISEVTGKTFAVGNNGKYTTTDGAFTVRVATSNSGQEKRLAIHARDPDELVKLTSQLGAPGIVKGEFLQQLRAFPIVVPGRFTANDGAVAQRQAAIGVRSPADGPTG